MGRIKTQLVKRLTNQLLKDHGANFTTEFDQNKVAVKSHLSGGSKKLRNVIAGYATRLKRQQLAEESA